MFDLPANGTVMSAQAVQGQTVKTGESQSQPQQQRPVSEMQEPQQQVSTQNQRSFSNQQPVPESQAPEQQVGSMSNAAVSEGRLATEEDNDEEAWTAIETKSKAQRQRRVPSKQVAKDTGSSKRNWRKDRGPTKSRSAASSPPPGPQDMGDGPASADESSTSSTPSSFPGKPGRSRKRNQRSGNRNQGSKGAPRNQHVSSQYAKTQQQHGNETSADQEYRPASAKKAPVTPNVQGAWRKPITEVIKQPRAQTKQAQLAARQDNSNDANQQQQQQTKQDDSASTSTAAVIMPPPPKQKHVAGTAEGDLSPQEAVDDSASAGAGVTVDPATIDTAASAAVRMPAPAGASNAAASGAMANALGSIGDPVHLEGKAAALSASSSSSSTTSSFAPKGWAKAKPTTTAQPTSNSEGPADEAAWPALDTVVAQETTDDAQGTSSVGAASNAAAGSGVAPSDSATKAMLRNKTKFKPFEGELGLRTPKTRDSKKHQHHNNDGNGGERHDKHSYGSSTGDAKVYNNNSKDNGHHTDSNAGKTGNNDSGGSPRPHNHASNATNSNSNSSSNTGSNGGGNSRGGNNRRRGQHGNPSGGRKVSGNKHSRRQGNKKYHHHQQQQQQQQQPHMDLTAQPYQPMMMPFLMPQPQPQPQPQGHQGPGQQEGTDRGFKPYMPFAPAMTVQHALKGQLEYYFSDRNLAKDTFLREKMDDAGVVDAEILASFPRMRSLFQQFGVHGEQHRQQRMHESVNMSMVLEAVMRSDQMGIRRKQLMPLNEHTLKEVVDAPEFYPTKDTGLTQYAPQQGVTLQHQQGGTSSGDQTPPNANAQQEGRVLLPEPTPLY